LLKISDSYVSFLTYCINYWHSLFYPGAAWGPAQWRCGVGYETRWPYYYLEAAAETGYDRSNHKTLGGGMEIVALIVWIIMGIALILWKVQKRRGK
jgi:hypothetical protein